MGQNWPIQHCYHNFYGQDADYIPNCLTVYCWDKGFTNLGVYGPEDVQQKMKAYAPLKALPDQYTQCSWSGISRTRTILMVWRMTNVRYCTLIQPTTIAEER